MQEHEKSGYRDLIYNVWHRPQSIGRFIPMEDAMNLRSIDIDLVECTKSGRTVLIHELARDIGQENKSTNIIRRMAQDMDCCALLTLYTPSEKLNPADVRFLDISAFRVRKIWPNPEQDFRDFMPDEYANYLNDLVKRLKRGG